MARLAVCCWSCWISACPSCCCTPATRAAPCGWSSTAPETFSKPWLSCTTKATCMQTSSRATSCGAQRRSALSSLTLDLASKRGIRFGTCCSWSSWLCVELCGSVMLLAHACRCRRDLIRVVAELVLRVSWKRLKCCLALETEARVPVLLACLWFLLMS